MAAERPETVTSLRGSLVLSSFLEPFLALFESLLLALLFLTKLGAVEARPDLRRNQKDSHDDQQNRCDQGSDYLSFVRKALGHISLRSSNCQLR